MFLQIRTDWCNAVSWKLNLLDTLALSDSFDGVDFCVKELVHEVDNLALIAVIGRLLARAIRLIHVYLH